MSTAIAEPTVRTPKLSRFERDILAELDRDGTIYSPALARALSRFAVRHADLVTTEPAPVDSSGAKAFFTLKLTDAGRAEIGKGGAS